MRHAEALGIVTGAGSSFASGFGEYLQRRTGSCPGVVTTAGRHPSSSDGDGRTRGGPPRLCGEACATSPGGTRSLRVSGDSRISARDLRHHGQQGQAERKDIPWVARRGPSGPRPEPKS